MYSKTKPKNIRLTVYIISVNRLIAIFSQDLKHWRLNIIKKEPWKLLQEHIQLILTDIAKDKLFAH